MKLKEFDKCRVRIIDIFDDIYDGICYYNDRDYNYHEYGKNEESLQLLNIIFYRRDIKSIDIIDDYAGSYGKIEEIIIEDGIDDIEDVFFLMKMNMYIAYFRV